MAVEYKITTNSDTENQIRGFAYSVVPAGNNVAGVTWKSAVSEWLASDILGTASKAPTLPAAVTQAQLDSGDMYEWRFTVPLDANLSAGAKETEVQTFLTNREPTVVTVLQNRLRFWGREGSA